MFVKLGWRWNRAKSTAWIGQVRYGYDSNVTFSYPCNNSYLQEGMVLYQYPDERCVFPSHIAQADYLSIRIIRPAPSFRRLRAVSCHAGPSIRLKGHTLVHSKIK